MHTHRPTDPRRLAAAALRHDASLALSRSAVTALIGIAERSTGHVSDAERQLLVAVLAMLAAAEVAYGSEVRP